MSGADDDPTRVDAPRTRGAAADDAETVVERKGRSSAPSLGATRREALPDLAREATPITADTDDASLPRSASIPRRSVLPPPSTTGGSAATATNAMQQQDLERMRSFLRTSVPVCLVVAAPLPWLGGEFVAAAVFGLAMVLCATAAFIVERQLRDPAAYTPVRIMSIGYLLTAGAYCGIAYCGVFSPAAGVIPFGLFFFGLSWSFRGTFAIYLTCSIVYAVLAGVIALDLMSDPGLVDANHLPLANRLALIGFAETVFFATYVVARFSRRATVDAIDKHDAAVRALATREALLHEARFDLEGALRARGLGRFTDEVVGGYRLGTVLGRGGMGEVYDAVHLDSEEPAAVKLLQPQLLSDEDTVKRFWREFHLAAKLHVPNVVRVLETSDPGAAIPYIAMERLHGQDLADYLRAHGRMKMVDMLRCVRDVGVGLDAARDASIVHRDIKPRNLFSAELPGGRRSGRSSTSA